MANNESEAPERTGNDSENSNIRQKGPKFMTGRKVFKKECTLTIDNIPNGQFSAGKVIEAAERICGMNTVMAVVPSDNRLFYEITTDSEENAMKLTNGIEIEDRKFNCALQFNKVKVVSFMHLPAYVDDADIIKTLTDRGCELKSDLFRHVHPRTQVADGTRYVHVKFPPGLGSLPWSMRFVTGAGTKYFRVKHNDQRSLCNKCGSPFHKYRQCPQLICEGCDKQGHKVRECTAPKCDRCHKLPHRCFCQPVNDGKCTQCKVNPCACICDACKKTYPECRCGLHDSDRRDTMNDAIDAIEVNERVEDEGDRYSIHSLDENDFQDDESVAMEDDQIDGVNEDEVNPEVDGATAQIGDDKKSGEEEVGCNGAMDSGKQSDDLKADVTVDDQAQRDENGVKEKSSKGIKRKETESDSDNEVTVVLKADVHCNNLNVVQNIEGNCVEKMDSQSVSDIESTQNEGDDNDISSSCNDVASDGDGQSEKHLNARELGKGKKKKTKMARRSRLQVKPNVNAGRRQTNINNDD